MPLVLFFPRKCANLKLFKRKPDSAWAKFSPRRWIDYDICLAWLKRFIKYTGCRKESPVLLFLDEDESHVKNINEINLAGDNEVIILCFPPHCTL